MSTLDNFTRAYITAALWSSNDESTPEGGEPMDSNYSLDDLAPATLARMMADCAKFQLEHARLLVQAYARYQRNEWTPEAQAGHDFWLTRCHHGAGFWDRSELDEGGLGEALTAAAQAFKEAELYIGDDKKVYQLGAEQ